MMARHPSTRRAALLCVTALLGAQLSCTSNGGNDRPPPIGANGTGNGSGNGGTSSGSSNGASTAGNGTANGGADAATGGSGGNGGSMGEGGAAGDASVGGAAGEGGSAGSSGGAGGGGGGSAGSGGAGGGSAGSGGSGGTTGSGGTAGSGGSVFGGSGGSVSHECTLTTSDSSCDDCIYKHCDSECVTCEDNSECVAIVTCIKSTCVDDQGKVDGACALGCRSDHPGGSTDFNKLVAPMTGCASRFCGGFCQFF